MINYSNEGFSDPKIVLKDGVAEIDMITLNLAAKKIDELIDDSLLLPESADVAVSPVFGEMSEVEVIQKDPIIVRATIDTKKVRWADENVRKASFKGYDGKIYYGVGFSHASVLSGQTAIIPIKLDEEEDMLMWITEIPEEKIESTKLYELYKNAKNIVSGYSNDLVENFDSIIIPAQQIKYERKMGEITEPNRDALKGGEVIQRAYVGLDETGIRVKAVTEMREGARINPDRKLKVFGDSGPVVFWFTEKDINEGTSPFAVFATTSEAWLDPETKVSFEDKEFTHGS